MLNHLVTPVSIVRTVFRINRFHTAACLLAGHSKWANIRHIKAAKDGEKSLIFAKYSHRMRLAIQEGGTANPQNNSTLRSIIEEALRKKMPNTTIQNTLKKYSEPNAIKLTKFFYDLRVLGKVYMVCALYTENVTKTKQDILAIIKKFSGTQTEARPMFDEQGVIEVVVPPEMASLDEAALEEKCTDDAIECGAEEVEVVDFTNKLATFICNANELNRVRSQLEKLGYVIESNEHVLLPKNPISLTGPELEKLELLKSKLKTVEGVQEIFDNVDYDQA